MFTKKFSFSFCNVVRCTTRTSFQFFLNIYKNFCSSLKVFKRPLMFSVSDLSTPRCILILKSLTKNFSEFIKCFTRDFKALFWATSAVQTFAGRSSLTCCSLFNVISSTHSLFLYQKFKVP